MKVRYAIAAAFVAVVASLIAVRDAGYLGGRTDGGPLRIGLREGLSAAASPGATLGVPLEVELDSGPVVVQSLQPRFASPGLRVRAPRLATDAESTEYPRDGRLLIGRTFDGEPAVVQGLRAKQPGVYYALGLVVDYRRGLRRFRHYDGQTICLEVGPKAACSAASVRVPDAAVAEVGGPSDYGVRLRGGPVARLPGNARHKVVLTLSNLTARTVEMADLRAGEADGVVLESARPEAFGIRGGRARKVKLIFAASGCPGMIVDALRARVDGKAAEVPLTIPLKFSAGC